MFFHFSNRSFNFLFNLNSKVSTLNGSRTHATPRNLERLAYLGKCLSPLAHKKIGTKPHMNTNLEIKVDISPNLMVPGLEKPHVHQLRLEIHIEILNFFSTSTVIKYMNIVIKYVKRFYNPRNSTVHKNIWF